MNLGKEVVLYLEDEVRKAQINKETVSVVFFDVQKKKAHFD